MMISGKERDVKVYNKYVGVGEFHVLGFNLTKDEILKKCGYEPKQEPIYVRKSPRGFDSVNLTVFLKEKTTGEIFRASFFLEKDIKLSSEGKPQYVNNKAMSSYVLQEWFTSNDYREAFIGEADFFNFLKNWLSNFDWFQDPDAKLDLKQTITFFTGNVKVLNDMALAFNKQTVGLLTGVKTNDGKEYQDIFTKAALPGYAVRKIQGILKNISVEEIEKQSYAIKQFLKQVTGQYGYNQFFGNNFTFREYNSSENTINTTGVVLHNTTPTPDTVSY